MDWSIVSAVCAVTYLILQVCGYVVTLRIKGEITELKLQIADSRARDQAERSNERDDLKEWVEERFIPRRKI